MGSGPEGTLKVAVMGAGIVGSSVAYRLTEGGADVILIDCAEPGSGTTSTSFAWVNANNKLPREYFELNMAGMREHERLRDDFGGGWLHSYGEPDLGRRPGEPGKPGRTPALLVLRGRDAPRFRGKREARTGSRFPHPEIQIAHFPEESWVDAPVLTRTLVGSPAATVCSHTSAMRCTISRWTAKE